MASTEEQTAWTWAAMEPEPTAHERALYDLFCQEYLVDRDKTRAASRCGFQAGFATDYGKQIFEKSYVQRKLAELQRAKPSEKDERDFDAVNTRARLRAIINDDMQKASARVAAARELNAMHGLHAPPRSAAVSDRGAAVLVPVMTLDDWERAANASQQALIEASRVD